MVNWMKSRMKERTSWDGAVCVALGLMILFMAPLAKIERTCNRMGCMDNLEI